MNFRRRVWSEFVPFRCLCDEALLKLLARYRVGLIVAVLPGQLEELPPLLRMCQACDVELDLWPMLDEGAGRWANTVSVPAMNAGVSELLSVLVRAEGRPGAIVLDLEPPISEMRALIDATAPGFHPAKAAQGLRTGLRWLAGRASARQRHRLGLSSFQKLLQEIAAAGLRVEAAALPLLLADHPGKRHGWEKILRTPVQGLNYSAISFMLYSTLFEGYVSRLIDRPRAKWLLYNCAERACRKYPGRAGVSVGITGPGALGDEPFYASLTHFCEDLGLVRAAGIEDIAVHGLEGILSREPEQWLAALAETQPASAPPTPPLGARALMRAMELASSPLALLA